VNPIKPSPIPQATKNDNRFR